MNADAIDSNDDDGSDEQETGDQDSSKNDHGRPSTSESDSESIWDDPTGEFIPKFKVPVLSKFSFAA